jgi:hypothetical protein
VRKILPFIWKHLDAWAGEAFTLVGLAIAWIVLPPGESRNVVGIICLGAFAVWTLFKVTLNTDSKDK